MSRIPRHVMVLGAGPSGLVAAHAASLAGAEVTIVSDTRRPSGMFGAQYLHEPIPYVTDNNAVRISYQLRGTAEGYRERVYGDQYVASVSPEEMESEHDAWDLRLTYARLWASLVERDQKLRLLTVKSSDIEPMKAAADLVVSSIPADRLCPGWNLSRDIEARVGHVFKGVEIWAAGDAPEIGIKLPYECPDNTVICNGDPDGPAWYRMARIYGRLSIEWPGSLLMRPPIGSLARVIKPTSTNCDCWVDEKFMRVGRYGTWTKGVLVHHAFNEVYERVITMGASR